MKILPSCILLCTIFLSSLPLTAQINNINTLQHFRSAEAKTNEPKHAQAVIDSLNVLLKTLSDRSEKIKIYGQLCFEYASTVGKIEIARLYADTVMLLEKGWRDKFKVSNYYYGLVGRYEGKYSESLDLLTRQIKYCEANGDSAMLANSLFQIAIVHKDLGNYEKGLVINYHLIKIYEKDRDYYRVGLTLMNIANLMMYLKKYDDAIKIFNQALIPLNKAEANLDVEMSKLRVLMNLGNTYLGMKQYEKARSVYRKSLIKSDSLGSTRTWGTCLSSMGEVLNGLGRPDSALEYHLKALAVRESTSQKDKILLSLTHVGETYMYLKQYKPATNYLLKALSIAQELHAKPATRDAAERLSTLYAVQNNFKKAYDYHKLFSLVRDSVLNEETTRQTSELQTKYETGKKDKQIALLAKEKEVQVKEARYQSTLKKAFIGGLVLVCILALMLVYIFRQRLKNQKLITAKNDEIKNAHFKTQLTELEMKALRAQINPHFLFNCINSINRMILSGETENASQYLNKFSKLIRLILENTESATVSLHNELAMLESYIQLEELRFKGKINYKILIDESLDIDGTYMPSMVLQPFVENAIWHGLMHKEKNDMGEITISVKESEDRLFCTVEDNGVGREKAFTLRENSMLKRKSMGLKITEERLKLLNNEQWEQFIKITDLKDSYNHATGTRVEINIPVS